MSRAVFCREQAQVCRDLSLQISNQADAARLLEMAQAYDTEAAAFDGSAQQQQQSQQRRK